MDKKKFSDKNRTLRISDDQEKILSEKFLKINSKISAELLENKIINQDFFDVAEFLPEKFVDLLFIDPPYNLSKTFNSNKFNKLSIDDYTNWLDNLIQKLIHTLKPSSSIYVCGDWLSSTSIHLVLNKYFNVRNRITWEREKGRGAKSNWKNSSEDIWFCTFSNNYNFNIDNVKLKRKVIAPYKENGKPKDWENNSNGNFRLTHPANIWTDITIPFWSMPENTEHPTQKPEKLLAKIILASSKKDDLIFDPFLGSGTTAVVAKKLSRKFCGIEIDKKFASLALKRLEVADENKEIQGYKDGVFWERNTLGLQNKKN
ncbi:MAG: DNA adenine methylase [Ignavibacteriae bacterium]|nr:DNA adenine methylase [Ignavibacteriota bacterium]